MKTKKQKKADRDFIAKIKTLNVVTKTSNEKELSALANAAGVVQIYYEVAQMKTKPTIPKLTPQRIAELQRMIPGVVNSLNWEHIMACMKAVHWCYRVKGKNRLYLKPVTKEMAVRAATEICRRITQDAAKEKKPFLRMSDDSGGFRATISNDGMDENGTWHLGLAFVVGYTGTDHL